MIRFDSIRVVNFALYTDVALHFSQDPDRPLTLIRGQNESGKTTLMRAFLWALFGQTALPRIPDARHPVRPVWAKPGESPRTRVEVRFRAGSDRGVSFFKLTRAVDTSDNGDAVAYGNESVALLRRDGDDWKEQEDEFQLLLKQFFRPEMRDFYFVDADKAVEFVGGPEGRHNDQMMRDMTTQSIRALLGLDMMLKAKDRMDDRQTSYLKQAGSQSSAAGQQDLVKELEDKDEAFKTATNRLAELAAQEREHENTLKNAEHELEESLSKLEELSATNVQYEEVTRKLNDARLKQNELLNELAACLDDDRLFAALLLPVIDGVMDKLQPLKDKGYIPPSELTLLPRLLSRDKCICGTDLLPGSVPRKHIEDQISKAQSLRGQSQMLDAALETARNFGNRAVGNVDRTWKELTESIYKELGNIDPVILQLTEQQEALREERDKAGATTGALRELQKHRDELRNMLDTLRDRRKASEVDVERLQREVRSLRERIRVAASNEKRTQHARCCAEVAEHLQTVIGAAYDVIEREQVLDVSRSMNTIFRNVISATSDSLFGEVGIRPVATQGFTKQYEVYTMEGNREKPLALANGASRRAIGVAFVLALAEETRTKVPLVADSLLHAMSGAVKYKIVDYLTAGDRIGQPVLFGTRTDLLDDEVTELLKRRAGKTYTLTSQAHAGGDVVRAVPAAKCAKQVVICDCEIDQVCPACERAGDQARIAEGRLTLRQNSEVLA